MKKKTPRFGRLTSPFSSMRKFFVSGSKPVRKKLPQRKYELELLEERIALAFNVSFADGVLTLNSDDTTGENLTVGYNGAEFTFADLNNAAFNIDVTAEEVFVDNGNGNAVADASQITSIEIFTAAGFSNIVTITDLDGATNLENIAVIGQDLADTFDASTNTNADVSISLMGNGGDDVLSGGAGNDYLDGGEGDDSIDGGDGDDTITGGLGADTIDGGAGFDVLVEGGGSFTLTDTMLNDGTDTDSLNSIESAMLLGSSGDDTLDASAFSLGPVVLVGLEGNDSIVGTDNNDSLVGGDDSDTIIGGAGNDTLIAAAGNDWVEAGDGDDSVLGDEGNDTIVGGQGEDTIFAGSADDLIIWNDGDGSDSIDGQDGQDTVQVNGSDTNGDDISVLDAGGRFTVSRTNTDIFTLDVGTTEHLAIQTQGGSDTVTVVNLSSIGLEIMVDGGDGDDLLDASAQMAAGIAVTLLGGNGADVLRGSQNGDVLNGGDGNDTIEGGDGDDTIAGEGGDDSIDAGDGDDLVSWNSDGSDTISGGAGTDTVQATGGASGENFVVPDAVGPGFQLTNDLVSFTLVLDTIEDFSLNAAGGEDTITIGDLDGSGLDRFTVLGGNGEDSINVVSSEVAFTIDGGAPPTGSGDVLNFDAQNQNVSANGTMLQAGSDGAVTYSNLEAINILNAAGDMTISGTAGDDNIVVLADGPDSGVYQVNGGPMIAFSGVTSLTFLGGDGDDTITITNPTGSLLAPTGGIFVDGGGESVNGDMLILQGGGGAGFTETYTVGPTNTEGEIVTTNGVVTQSITFTGLEPINTTVEADLVINGTAGDNLITVSNGDLDLILVQIDGFEQAAFGNKTNVTINGGGGNDTFDINFTNNGNGGTTSLATFTANADDGDDSIAISSVGAGIAYMFNGGDGNDTITAIDLLEELTITGGAGDDLLVGGDLDDSISGDAGSDTIVGNAGDDTITGGTEDDLIIWNAGDGSDLVDGGDGDDTFRIVGSPADEAFVVNPGTGTGFEVTDDMATYTIDVTTVENLDIRADDGADTVTVNDLTGVDDLQDITADLGNGADLFDASAQTNTAIGLTVLGGDGADTILGSDGDDSLLGEAGSDTIIGGLGADFIDGGSEADSLLGGDDDDTILGDAGDDTIDGGLGADLIDGGDDNDTITGDAGEDTILGGAGDDLIDGGDDDDSLLGEAGSDTIIGGLGDDFIDGGADDDSLVGDAGEDTIIGGLGDDFIDGGDDADSLLGEAGMDTIIGGLAGDFIDGGTDADSLVGGDGDDTIFGDAGSDTIDGGLGADLIDGGDDDDTITGGDGNDTILGGTGNDSIEGGVGDDSLLGEAGMDTILGGLDNDFIDGGADDDSLVGDAGDDTIFGDAGDDIIDGGADNDLINGGIGDDSIFGDTGLDTIFGDAGSDTIDGGVGDDLIDGGDDGDLLIGAGGNDTILGGAGDDLIFGNEDDDSLLGGAGMDTIAGDVGSDTIMGGDDNDSIFGGADDDLIDGGDGDDTILGGAGADTIFGDLGADFISGGSEGDLIDGGDGDDTILGGADADTVTGGMGDDLINTGLGGDLIDGGGGDDSIDGSSGADTIMGGDGDDTISGGTDDDSISGGLGNDSIFGNAGNDTITGDDGLDFIDGGAGTDSLLGGVGDDTILGGTDTLVAGNAGDTILGGDDNDSLIGSAADDSILGEAGNDTVLGAAGNDTLVGGDGDDSMLGGDDADVLNGNGGDDTLFGDGGNDIITGDAGNDRLFGGDGNDNMDGGADNDTLTGNAGNDTMAGGAGTDLLVESGGSFKLTNTTLTGATGTDMLSGFENASLTGSGADDTFDARGFTAGSVTLDGLAGDDTFYGSPNNDSLIGGDGTDLVIASGGSFVLNDAVLQGSGGANTGTDGLSAIELASLAGTAGSDTLNAAGFTGNTTLNGFGGNDLIIGGDGADIILGGNGNDTIDGRGGNDSLLGEAGDDSIIGGLGGDTLIGGPGFDTFMAVDNIQDFLFVDAAELPFLIANINFDPNLDLINGNLRGDDPVQDNNSKEGADVFGGKPLAKVLAFINNFYHDMLGRIANQPVPGFPNVPNEGLYWTVLFVKQNLATTANFIRAIMLGSQNPDALPSPLKELVTPFRDVANQLLMAPFNMSSAAVVDLYMNRFFDNPAAHPGVRAAALQVAQSNGTAMQIIETILAGLPNSPMLDYMNESVQGFGAATASSTMSSINFNVLLEPQSINRNETATVPLPEAAGQRAINYSTSVTNQAYQIKTGLSLIPSASYSFNKFGLQEKWLTSSNGNQYYILPNGNIHRYLGGRIVNNVFVHSAGVVYYNDPSLLTNAKPGGGTATVIDGVLTVVPDDDFYGKLFVTVRASDGLQTKTSMLPVSVTNDAPIIYDIADQTVSHGGTIRVEFTADDPDGDDLQYFVHASNPLGDLAKVLGITNGPVLFNIQNHNEKWFRSTSGDQTFFILPNGNLFRAFNGKIGSNQLIAKLGVEVYNNPSLLYAAKSIGSVRIEGDEIVIETNSSYVGSFTVTFSASDGVAAAVASFVVNVTNAAPVLPPIANQTISGSTSLDLDADDADVDELSYTVTLTNRLFNIKQSLGITNGPVLFNIQKHNEKWFRSTSGDQTFFILPNGKLYRAFGGRIGSNQFITTLGVEVYNDPSLLYAAQPLTASAVLRVDDFGRLTIDPPMGYTGIFVVTVNVSDGIATASRTFEVTVVDTISGTSLAHDPHSSGSGGGSEPSVTLDEVMSSIDEEELALVLFDLEEGGV